ncbi:MAG TPA: hypothetical protein VNC61_13590 [Acidimicrobiales bacterium]|nr:hypothetical protein [Acidimicrobiales bacterium]
MTNFGQSVATALDAQQAGELARTEAIDTATATAAAMLLDGVPPVLNKLFFHACEAANRRS